MTIYAKLHNFNHTEYTISARFDQPDNSWVAYDVPNVDWLYLDINNTIQVHTQTEMDITAASEEHAILIEEAKVALFESDKTVVRTYEAVLLGNTTNTTPDVIAFMQYRKALRNIIDGTDTISTTLPTKPAYPVGT